LIQEILLSCELIALIPQASNADFSAASLNCETVNKKSGRHTGFVRKAVGTS